MWQLQPYNQRIDAKASCCYYTCAARSTRILEKLLSVATWDRLASHQVPRLLEAGEKKKACMVSADKAWTRNFRNCSLLKMGFRLVATWTGHKNWVTTVGIDQPSLYCSWSGQAYIAHILLSVVILWWAWHGSRANPMRLETVCSAAARSTEMCHEIAFCMNLPPSSCIHKVFADRKWTPVFFSKAVLCMEPSVQDSNWCPICCNCVTFELLQVFCLRLSNTHFRTWQDISHVCVATISFICLWLVKKMGRNTNH